MNMRCCGALGTSISMLCAGLIGMAGCGGTEEDAFIWDDNMGKADKIDPSDLESMVLSRDNLTVDSSAVEGTLKRYLSLKNDLYRAHQYIVEVPEDLAQSLSATVSIGGWDQQVNVVQLHLTGMKFAWAFVPAGNPIEECYSELYAQLDKDPLTVPLDRRYMGTYQKGSLVIWLAARPHPNNIEYSLKVNLIPELKKNYWGQVLAGYDYNEDGQLDEDQWRWPLVDDHDPSILELTRSTRFTFDAQSNAPFVLYWDAMQTDPRNLQIFLNSAKFMIPPGSEVTILNHGCWNVKKEIGPMNVSSWRIKERPIICQVDIILPM